MKKILFLSCMLLAVAPSVTVFGQQQKAKVVVLKNKAGKYSYEKTVPVKDIPKEVMYSRVKKWLSNVPAQFDDAALAVTRSGELPFAPGPEGEIISGHLKYNLKVQFRKGAYSFIFDNLIAEVAYSKLISEMMIYENTQKDTKPANYIRNQINERLQDAAAQLDDVIHDKTVVQENREQTKL